MARGSELSARQDPDVLVRDIEATRHHLATTIDAIVDRTNPKNVAQRTLDKVKAQFVNPDGSPRLERIVPIAGAVMGTVGLGVMVRRLGGRR